MKKRIIIILVVVGIILGGYKFFDIRFFKISGYSMYPTIEENDLVVSIKKNGYKQGDIIVFDHGNVHTIKRVIGKPGDIVDIKDNLVYVNNELLKEDYVKNKEIKEVEVEMPTKVDDNCYFVLGDNREDSLDSRVISFGCVKKENILGKVLFK